MDSLERFGEEKLPDRECFYSSVKYRTTGDNGKKLGHNEDYLTRNKIWNKDFQKFIDTCLKVYKLDPCHYVISPGLNWDAMLKLTGVKLEETSNVDMYLFIEKGLRGGTSYIAKRYSKANKKYMKNYDPTERSKFITYLDVNNLYG